MVVETLGSYLELDLRTHGGCPGLQPQGKEKEQLGDFTGSNWVKGRAWVEPGPGHRRLSSF